MANYQTPENHRENGLRVVENQPHLAVVVVPFPAQGHLGPLLHLSRRISAYNIPVYYIGAATHIRQAKARVHGWDPSAITNLHFHGFATPPFPNLSPDSTSSRRYPSHLGPMFSAVLSHFCKPLFMLANKLSLGNGKTRVVVIFDSLMASVVQAIQILPHVESYCFQSTPAFFSYSLYWEAAGKPDDIPTEAGIMKELPSMEGCLSPQFQEFAASQRKARNFHSGTIYSTSRIIEGLYLDLLAKTGMPGPDKHWAVGPSNLVFGDEKHDSKSRSKCLDWLDKQPPNSVIFVSFGTSSSLSDEQIRELAFGLERNKQKFIWALRDADRGDIFNSEVRIAELPEGFEERVQERGIVVREWAPQLEILMHRSTGGFLSHCGWNSCMESISMGVPIAAWPMHSDQPRNSVLITKVLKIGLEVRDWAHRDELVCSVTIEEAVKRLMASAEGDEMRQRAEKLASAMKQSMMEGGATCLEMDSFIAHISR